MFLKRTQIRLARSIVALLAAGFIQVGISAPVANAAPLPAPTITSSTVTATSMTVNLQTSGVAASSWRYIVNRRTVTGCSSPVSDGAVQSTGSLQSSITISGLTEGCYFTVKVAAFNGAIGAYAAVEKLVNGYVNGLKVYYKSETTTASAFTRTPFTSGTCATGVLTSLNQNWGQGGPNGCGSENYTAYIVGYIKAPYTGSVTFKSTNDDGLQLNVQGQQIFFNSISGSSPSGSINMVQDEIYRIELWFHEIGGLSYFSLNWEYGSQASIAVPTANMATDPSVFFGTCPIGLDPRCAAGSALEIKRATGTNMDGHYWILINGTPTLVYCIMNSSQGGGGWMLAMRGKNNESTFTYNSSYWVNSSLTNETYPQRFKADPIGTLQNTDAKYEPFTSVKSNQIMVLYPERTEAGGAYSATNKNQMQENYGFSWSETITTTGSSIRAWTAYDNGWGGTSYNQGLSGGPAEKPIDPSGTASCISTANTLTYLFLNANRCAFRQVSATYDAAESPYSAIGNNLFYSQNRIRFFGINYGASSAAPDSQKYKARIGFGWNENVDAGQDTSNDGGGGIGTYMPNSNKLAAGSYYGCCAEQAGVASGTHFAFELYVRNTVEIGISGHSTLSVTKGRTSSLVAARAYYLSDHTGTTTFRLSSIREGFTIDATTGVISVSEALPVGSYTTVVTASDANNASGAKTVTINVLADSSETDSALSFNGSNQFVSNVGTFSTPGDFTYEFWVKPNNDCSQQNGFSKPVSTTNLWISCWGGMWYFSYMKADNSTPNFELSQKVVANDWAHFAIVRTNSGSTGETYIYYNNRQINLYNSGWVSSVPITSFKGDFGYIRIGGSGTANEYFNGHVDEVKVWQRARSLTDIWLDAHRQQNLYEDLLILTYDFNEASGNAISRGQRGDYQISLGSVVRTPVAITTSVGPYTVVTVPRTLINSIGGWRSPETITAITALVIGGGGGGGGGLQGGGGGAGGFLESTVLVDPTSVYEIKVGVGGAGFLGYDYRVTTPSNGQDSVAFGFTAKGGGYGGTEYVSPNNHVPPSSGGSGGGGTWGNTSAYYLGAAGTSGQGFKGGNTPTIVGVGAGGGGAGGEGLNASASKGGDGGAGKLSIVTGTTLAGGGGGARRDSNAGGAGGTGGGGAAATSRDAAVDATGGPQSGGANTGSGGGGGIRTTSNTDGLGGNGGSGVVVFRYITASKPTFTKPTNAYLNVGMTETFTVNVAQDSETAQLTRTFRWESSTTGSSGTFTKIKEGTGAANAYLSWVPSDTSTSGSNFVYRVIVTDSDTAGLFIQDTSTPVFATINRALVLTSKSTINKAINTSKSETFTVTLGTPTYRYTLEPTSANFWLDTSTTGSPVIKIADTVTVGTYYETFTVIDSVSASIVVPLTINITGPPSFSASGEMVDSGTVLYLDAGNSASYSGSGTTWSDLSGRAINANLTHAFGTTTNYVDGTTKSSSYTNLTCGGASFSSTNLGSFSFPTVGQCIYVNSALPTLADFRPVYTLDTWIKRSGPQTAWRSIICNPYRVQYDQIFLCLFWTGTNTLNAGIFNGSAWQQTESVAVEDSTWTHIAVTYDGNQNLRMYINDVSYVYSKNNVSVTWNAGKNNPGLIMGRKWDEAVNFSGAIATVRVYNRVLSDAEILQNFNATKGRFLGTQNKQSQNGKYGTTVSDTYTVTSGLETLTATFSAGAITGLKWDTSTVRSLKLQLQDSLSAGTYNETITITDAYGQTSRLPLTFTIAKADTLTAYIDTPTALSYTGSAASFATNLIISGLKNSDTGTVSVSYKPGGLTCATGGSCSVGDIGPGGGIVFITPATTNGNGKYFEAAPSNWTGSDDLASVGKFCEGSTNQDSINRGASQYGIGWGETNTALFESYCTGGAVKKVTSYAGGGYTDWFVPNSNELAELANVRNQAGLLELGANWATGNQGYWGSTEADASTMRTLVSVNSAWNIGSTSKSDSTHLMVRPVRMFSSCWAVDSCTAQASSTKPTDAGTYSITPSSLKLTAGSLSNYEAVLYRSTTVTINKISQSTLNLSTYSLFYPETMTIGTSGGNGSGRLLFTITGSSGPSCILDWRKLAASTPGTCTVEVNKAADRNYLATTTSAIINFALFIPFVPLPTPEPGPSIGIQGTNSFIVDSNLAPAFTGLSASSGSIGSSITISGLGFSFADISKVAIKFWRGVVATTYSIPNDSTINVTVPTGATTGRIVITTPNGSVGTTTFTVTP